MLLPFRKKYNDRSPNEGDWSVAKLIKTFSDSLKALGRCEVDGFSLDNYNQVRMDRCEKELTRRGYTIKKERI